jgi:hypothetical protein
MSAAIRMVRPAPAVARFGASSRHPRVMSILSGGRPAALQKHREMLEKIRLYEQSVAAGTSSTAPHRAAVDAPAAAERLLMREGESLLREAVDEETLLQPPVEEGAKAIMTRILAGMCARTTCKGGGPP